MKYILSNEIYFNVYILDDYSCDKISSHFKTLYNDMFINMVKNANGIECRYLTNIYDTIYIRRHTKRDFGYKDMCVIMDDIEEDKLKVIL